MAEKDETEGRCPACRTIYEKDKIVAMQADCERVASAQCSKKSKPPKATKPKTTEVKKDLTNVRVIQRKMAYVIGLPLSLADEDVLQRKEYFGQYGKISKISLSRTAGGAIQQFINDTCSVYVTYTREEEAVRCIQSVHGFVLDGRYLRASFGTAKYCHAWLRNMPCGNPTCLYLHTIGADEDSFGKDEVAAVHTRNRVQEVAGASNSILKRSGNVLPPPFEEFPNTSDSALEKFTARSSPSDSAQGGPFNGGKMTTFVDVVGRPSSSGPEKDENSSEDRRTVDLCSDRSSVVKEIDNHFGDTCAESLLYKVPSPGHLVSRLPRDRGSNESCAELVREDMIPSDDLLKDPSNSSQGAFSHSSYPARTSEDSSGHSGLHKRTHSSSSFSIDQSSVHSLEEEALPFTCVNSVLNDQGHELKFQASAKSDRIYRSSNSFSNEEIVEHLRRMDDENSTNDVEKCALDAVENSIISNIMSIDLDSFDDSLTLPHGLTELLDETNDRNGSSWNSFTSHDSGFSFSRRDGLTGASFESSLNNLGQMSNTSFKEHYLSNPQHQVSRPPPSLAPPGFSLPSREVPPPGFSAYDRTGRFSRSSSGSYLNTSLPGSLFQLPVSVNNGSNSDIDFADPAILSYGKGKPTNGLNLPGLNTRPPSSNQQMGGLDDETRLWLLMQQQATADQASKYSQMYVPQTPSQGQMGFPGLVGDDLASLNDVYGYQSRLMDQQRQTYEPPSYGKVSQQQMYGNGHISNGGYPYGFADVQRKNEVAMAELQRNDRLMNKYFSGYGDSMYQMANSGDVYTRVFGIAELSEKRNACGGGIDFLNCKLWPYSFVPCYEVSALERESVKQVLPPALDSSSDPPAIFDGIPKLYISYTCPYAQRVWITRNCKGLQDKIKLIPIDLKNRPTWYKDKVYPANKVPALEHNNEVIGESLDLIRYLNDNFEGPSLLPDDPTKREFAEELLSYTDSFHKGVTASFKGEGITEAGASFDYIETALKKFDDGPFFLGDFSIVDIAYAPFIERHQPFLADVMKYDITMGRPKLAAWIEEINKIDAYKVTKSDPKELVESYEKRFLVKICYL
ncbi:OLC1v1025931C1 [Oldenlandia corymbosa var. corymbosa]|uniref:glutathione transferase n=1 Tax=Oldenlandia corymbosa var. corymbosa TaxID=529605 RepID=A0AAV1C8Q9_OLDCO|nr:OLC1v1025931C1 [Oldenlandia corymbosa var. corymbosa]